MSTTCLDTTLPIMSTHNICFNAEIRKIFIWTPLILSSDKEKKVHPELAPQAQISHTHTDFENLVAHLRINVVHLKISAMYQFPLFR